MSLCSSVLRLARDQRKLYGFRVPRLQHVCNNINIILCVHTHTRARKKRMTRTRYSTAAFSRNFIRNLLAPNVCVHGFVNVRPTTWCDDKSDRYRSSCSRAVIIVVATEGLWKIDRRKIPPSFCRQHCRFFSNVKARVRTRLMAARVW